MTVSMFPEIAPDEPDRQPVECEDRPYGMNLVCRREKGHDGPHRMYRHRSGTGPFGRPIRIEWDTDA